VINTVGAMV